MRLWESGVEYREIPFPAAQTKKRFKLSLVAYLLFIFPAIPLLAYWGLNEYLLWISGLFAWGLTGYIAASMFAQDAVPPPAP
ncbi:hypothetical protein GWK36_09555 [Caldichromatium japonicum]|uniref:Uncharacterized protein n=1 Tax=Caldichromatium japonicum TaxID=2699430 RepID=A0A6G7VE00_9GAMM|nr:hypothetical protein [Caldichromatium japonicum]QIK38182.1 hypothetical protein GWK36_09555 [Caldichromatium japonicum]